MKNKNIRRGNQESHGNESFRRAQKSPIFGGAANRVRVHAEKYYFSCIHRTEGVSKLGKRKGEPHKKLSVFWRSRKSEGFSCALGETYGFPPKGQFFIISAVIIASLLLIISHNFSGFGAISLTKSSEMSELEYISMIKKSLNDTAAFSKCDALDEEISTAEKFFSRKLAEQGIQMSAAHNIASCGSMRFSFNLSSSGFFSSTEFNYP